MVGALGRGGLLRRSHLGDGIGGRQERPAHGEDDHEPPVPRTGGRQRGDGESEAAGEQQHPAPTHPVGQAGNGQAAERGQSDDGQPQTHLGTREPGLIGDRGPVHHVAEVPGHVAERGGQAELTEAGGQGDDPEADHGAIGPTVEYQAVGGGPRAGGCRPVVAWFPVHWAAAGGLTPGT